MADQLVDAVLEISGTTVPFHIQNVESSLSEHISYAIETVQEGMNYRLRISNKTKKGNYTGYIKFYTDLPQKPDLLLRVSGFVEGEVSIKPLTILVGKLSPDQPERSGKVTVTSNRNKPFQITDLTYDERLVSVSRHPLEKEEGYILEISPKLENVPSGARQQTLISIETNLTPGEKDTVQVHLFNSSERPEVRAIPK